MVSRVIWRAVWVVAFASCGGSDKKTMLTDAPTFPDPDSGIDTGIDAAIDAGLDAAFDSMVIDAMAIDSAPIDSTATDSMAIDASPIDAHPIDATATDSTPIDSTPIDAHPIDAHPIDATPIDAPPPIDSIAIDSTPIDAPAGIPPCTPATWCVETPPVAHTTLAAAWAVSAADVFVVGNGGTILRRKNNAWTQQVSNTTANLRGVWAASSTDVWAVGQAGTLMRFNGATWSPTGNFSVDFKAVWGSSATDVWIAGFGVVVHWDGSQFTQTAMQGTLFSISGTGPTDVWVTGESAKVDHFTGTWTTGIVPLATVNTYFAICALATTNVLISNFTPTKETLQWSGASWTPRAAPGSVFLGMFATSPTNVWAAGNTKVGHWDGTAWATDTPAGASAQFLAISGAGADVWAVGDDSLILHRN